jgi:hypothetical protein
MAWSDVAGPKVAMILQRRNRRIGVSLFILKGFF